MGEFTQNHHKSMAVLSNGETIFERQIRILSECGLKDFVVTTGPFKEQLEQVANQERFKYLNFTFVENPIYEKTNYIYSMYLAREYFQNDSVLTLHGDLVFDKKLILDILRDSRESLATANKSKPLPEKDFKCRIQKDCILEVSINIFDKDCFAFQPLYKLSKEDMSKWISKVEEYINNGNDKVYAENAFNEILPYMNLGAFLYENYFIDEVDNLEDLSRVSQEIRNFDFEEQRIFFNSNFIDTIKSIIEENHASKILLVSGKTYDNFIYRKNLENLDISIVPFSDFSSNPKYTEIVTGVDLFRKEKCDFIVSLGGGSAIDTAKAIKLFSNLDDAKNYLDQEYKYNSVKHLCIPTTAGTGSESTRYAVIYYNNEKQSLTHDSIIPELVILDSNLIKTVPDYQKKSTMLDVLCQAIESYWSVNSTEKSKVYATEAIKLILENYINYFNNLEESYEKILYASNLSGKAINISQTTAAHAMSYKLTSNYGIAHGHAVALILPHLWELMDGLRCLDIRGEAYFRNTLEEINKLFGCSNKEEAIEHFRSIYNKMNFNDIHIVDRDLNALANSVNVDRLKNTPINLNRNDIIRIYKKISINGRNNGNG